MHLPHHYGAVFSLKTKISLNSLRMVIKITKNREKHQGIKAERCKFFMPCQNGTGDAVNCQNDEAACKLANINFLERVVTCGTTDFFRNTERNAATTSIALSFIVF